MEAGKERVMHQIWIRFCLWVCFYALLLLACLAALWVTGIPNWQTTAAGCWLLLCFGSLCVPDEIWDRKLFGRFLR